MLPNLVKKHHQRLSRVVGADHQAARAARHGVLRNHALAGLDVAVVLIQPRLVEQVAHLAAHFRMYGVDRRFDVDGHGAVGADDGQRILRVGFISLYPVRQAHGEERGLMASMSAVARCRCWRGSPRR